MFRIFFQISNKVTRHKYLYIERANIRYRLWWTGEFSQVFKEKSLEAYGIDRLQENTGYFRSIDWLEFDYFQLKWGTIISNISFSNHFIHHFTQNDGIDILYAQTYMKILKSLDNGGKWIYAPSVPFIENLLPKDEFSVQRIQINESFSKTIVHKFLVLWSK